jgi:hypothetical protein
MLLNLICWKFSSNRMASEMEPKHHWACNPSYLRGWEQEDLGLIPARANSLRNPISKILPRQNGLEVWLKQQSTFASAKSWVQTPIPPKNKQKTNKVSLVFSLVAVLGFELRASYLLGTTWATPRSFCFSWFLNRVSHLCLGWPGLQSSYLHFPHS